MRTLKHAWLLALAAVGAAGCTSDVAGPGASGNGNGGASGASGTSGSSGASGASGSSGQGTGGSAGTAGASGTGATGANGACENLESVPRRIWRLSARQYSNAVRDVLGTAAGPELTSLGGENPLAFFTDDALTVDYSMLNDMYQLLGAQLDQTTARIPQLTACTSGEVPAACARRFAESFGKKAFRRPLDPTEVDALVAPYTAGAAQDFNTGIRLMMQAALLSPSFLFRTELGTPQAPNVLSSPELASQLSFLLRNSIPDDALLAAGENGALATPEGTQAEVDRLLALPEVRQNVARIVADWFNVRGVLERSKATTYFDGLPPPAAGDIQTAVKADLVTSAQMFIDNVLWTGTGDLSQLLSSPRMYVNQRLATLYGLPYTGNGTDFVAADAPADQRAGMLTQPALVWANSGTETTSIVHRGLAVLHDIVAGPPVAQPVGILDRPDIIAALAMLPTEMDKANFRSTTAECVGCHIGFDGYGIALQTLDPIGRFQTTTEGAPVNAAGIIESDYFSATFNGPVELAQALLGSDIFMNTAAKKFASYAVGRPIDKGAVCQVQELKPAVVQGGNTASALVRAIILARFARERLGVQ